VWRRADADLKARVWRRYGLFCALAFFESVGGLVAAAADIQFRNNYSTFARFTLVNPCAQISLAQILAQLDCYAREAVNPIEQFLYWLSVSPVPYAIEFLCICSVNLLVRLQ
jgi:hypothetical protein